MPRRPAKQRTVAEWQISRVAKKAVYLGKVEAADAETAIKAAIKRYDTGWTKAARERGAESIAARTNARARTLAPTIKRARAAGATSLHAIARYLNEQGIPTTRGYEWSAVQVARVIRRLSDLAPRSRP